MTSPNDSLELNLESGEITRQASPPGIFTVATGDTKETAMSTVTFPSGSADEVAKAVPSGSTDEFGKAVKSLGAGASTTERTAGGHRKINRHDVKYVR